VSNHPEVRRLGFLLALGLILVRPTAAPADEFGDCVPPPPGPGPIAVVVGVVTCQEVDAVTTLGGVTAISYYVPPNCDPAIEPPRTCPVLTLLHGFGGTWQGEAGTADAPSAKVRSLALRPPVDPYAVKDPWNYSDPDAWVPADPLDFIVIAPHGRTLEGGFGPAPGLDSFWTNWNPRYANRDAGNPDGVYDGPPPRFEDFVARDLPAFVEERFATAGHGRDWRALQGTSLGGYGSYELGLKHPDVWASIGSISGAHNFLFTPWLDPGPAGSVISTAPPVPLPYVKLPGLPPKVVPIASLPEQLKGFAVAFFALGDPVADQAYFRGSMPRDLAMNARGWAPDGAQSLHLRGFVNDARPRMASDLTDPVAQIFETIVLPMNIDQDFAFTSEHVERTFEIHPGLHAGRYWNPFLRAQMEAQYARVLHWKGDTTVVPPASRFDYRTVATTFDVWGWRFEVARDPVEFLTFRDVSCDGLTLQGTGVVTVHVPVACGTGFDPDGAGPAPPAADFALTLGNAHPIDEPLGLGALPFYGATRTVALTAL
jgi:hypothetical protein